MGFINAVNLLYLDCHCVPVKIEAWYGSCDCLPAGHESFHMLPLCKLSLASCALPTVSSRRVYVSTLLHLDLACQNFRAVGHVNDAVVLIMRIKCVILTVRIEYVGAEETMRCGKSSMASNRVLLWGNIIFGIL